MSVDGGGSLHVENGGGSLLHHHGEGEGDEGSGDFEGEEEVDPLLDEIIAGRKMICKKNTVYLVHIIIMNK